MIKNIYTLLLVAVLTTVFFGCATERGVDSVSRAVSEDNKDYNSSDTADVSERTDFESSNLIDGIYYGNEISFNVPDGYELYEETEESAYFYEKNIISMILLSVKDTDITIEDLDRKKAEDFETSDTFIVSYDRITISDVQGALLVYNKYLEQPEEEISGDVSDADDSQAAGFDETKEHSTVYQYTFLNNSKVVTLAFYTEGEDISHTIESVTESVVFS
ncbi:MAG TPA: hypothetical protein DD733_04615 [Clostridiales bacterium]|nr:hypothetical protein [Eubacteriales bacterium]HBR31345.1 hypothetical protein [Clostridiales bacterium]